MDSIHKWDGADWDYFERLEHVQPQGVLSGRIHTLMDARELQKLFHELLDKNPNFEQFVRNLSLVVSYLVSEQDKRKALAQQIEEHSKAMNEANEQRVKMGIKLEQIYDRQEKSARLQWKIFAAVVSGLTIYLVQILLKFKP